MILLLTLDKAELFRFDRTFTFPELILLLILSIDCCLVLAGAARLTVFLSRLLCTLALLRFELLLRLTELLRFFDELLRLTAPELREPAPELFTVPELLLVELLLLFTELLFLLSEDRLRFTFPELRFEDRLLLTVPLLLLLERFLFTVPWFLLLDPLRLRTVDEERFRFTVDLVLLTRSVRAEERTFVLTALPPTLASLRVFRLTFDLLRDERALVLGLYVLDGLFTTVFA